MVSWRRLGLRGNVQRRVHLTVRWDFVPSGGDGYIRRLIVMPPLPAIDGERGNMFSGRMSGCPLTFISCAAIFSLFNGQIAMKHVSSHCWEGFQGHRTKVRVIAGQDNDLRDAIKWRDFNKTSSCDWKLPRRLSKSWVKGLAHSEAKCNFSVKAIVINLRPSVRCPCGGGIPIDSVALRLI